MRKISLFIMPFFVLLALSCVNPTASKTSENITIVFDSIKQNYDTLYFKDGASSWPTSPALTLTLSSDESKILEIKDTIEIEPTLDYIIVHHRYDPISSVDFLLKAGDKACLEYIQGIPFVNLSNRKTKKHDLNYDYYKRQRYPLIEDMQLMDIIKIPSTYMYKRLLKGERCTNQDIFREFYPKFLDELKDESIWLDSLYQVALISEKEYRYYKDRNKFQNLNLIFNSKTQEELENELKEYNDSIYSNDIAGFYKNYYLQLALYRINRIAPTFKDNKHTEIYDYVVEEDKIISGKLSQDIRQVILGYILNNTSLEIRNEYFNKFASSTTDTVLINRLKIQYKNLLNPEIAISNDLVLLSADGKKITFSEVLKQCEGKIVYVDFWASWCEPCLREMPNSKQLRDDETYKNIVFIYLALNDKKERWEAAWKKACLEDYTHNYMILNSADASFISKYKINSIPRYMIFGKDGRILNPDAPRPSDNKINKILTDY